MSVNKQGRPPRNYWQNTYDDNTASAPAFDIHLHDNIMLEQCKIALSTSRPSESDKKQNETNKETLKYQRNNRKTERKSEKTINKYIEKQKDSKAPLDWQLNAGLQQSRLTEEQLQIRKLGSKRNTQPHTKKPFGSNTTSQKR